MVFLLIFKRRERADKREESFCSEMSLGQAGYGEAKPGLLFSSKLPCFCSPLYRNTSHPDLASTAALCMLSAVRWRGVSEHPTRRPHRRPLSPDLTAEPCLREEVGERAAPGDSGRRENRTSVPPSATGGHPLPPSERQRKYSSYASRLSGGLEGGICCLFCH